MSASPSRLTETQKKSSFLKKTQKEKQEKPWQVYWQPQNTGLAPVSLERHLGKDPQLLAEQVISWTEMAQPKISEIKVNFQE